jgi:type II restriction enzyme
MRLSTILSNGGGEAGTGGAGRAARRAVLPLPALQAGADAADAPPNFKCADVICDFCGYLAQVKASTSADGATPPKLLLGAAWGPQKQRMDSGIYFPLFLVLVAPALRLFSIHYLSADLQTPELFLPRNPLGEGARRAGWQGFYYDLGAVRDRLVVVAEGRLPVRRPRAAAEPAVAAE